MTVIDDIKERLDIAEIIGQHVQLKKSGKHMVGMCPFHPNTHTPAFTVFPDTRSFHCFGCKANGSVFDFVMRYEHVDFREVLERLALLAQIELPARDAEVAAQQSLFHGLLDDACAFWQANLWSPRGRAALSYMQARGIREQTLRDWRVGYATDSWNELLQYLTEKYPDLGLSVLVELGLAGEKKERFFDIHRNRIMFPICDSNGHVISMGGRSLGDTMPKYLNGPQNILFHKKHTLFGLPQAKQHIRSRGRAVVVEGYMDVLAAHQAGHTNTVAILGTALGNEHFATLKSLAPTVLLAFDADVAGKNALLRSLAAMRSPSNAGQPVLHMSDWSHTASVDIRVLHIPQDQDPADILTQQPAIWQTYVDQAMPANEYVIRQITSDVQPQQVHSVLQQLLPLLSSFPKYSVAQQQQVRLLSERLLLPAYAIYHALAKVRTGAAQKDVASVIPLAHEQVLLAALLLHDQACNAVWLGLQEVLQSVPDASLIVHGEIDALFQDDIHRWIWRSWSVAGSATLEEWSTSLLEPLRSYASMLIERGNSQYHDDALQRALRAVLSSYSDMWFRQADDQSAAWQACVSLQQHLLYVQDDNMHVPMQ